MAGKNDVIKKLARMYVMFKEAVSKAKFYRFRFPKNYQHLPAPIKRHIPNFITDSR